MKTGPKNLKGEKKAVADRSRRGEQGYALVGMIGVMLFALILTTAAAPSIKLEAQREKEEEMLWRGQQIQAALGRYSGGQGNNRRFPTELKELVEGVNLGTKKLHLLRPSALCDPMTPCDPGSSNWKLVHPGDPLIRELYEAYLALQQKGAVLPPLPPDLQMLAQQTAVQIMGQGSDPKSDGSLGSVQGSDSDSDSSLDKLPIVGVVSRYNGDMFRNYYGIERYQGALFYKALDVYASGFNSGSRVLVGGGAPNAPFAPDSANSTNCGPNQTLINGRCLNMVMVPGMQCRGPGDTIIPCPK